MIGFAAFLALSGPKSQLKMKRLFICYGLSKDVKRLHRPFGFPTCTIEITRFYITNVEMIFPFFRLDLVAAKRLIFCPRFQLRLESDGIAPNCNFCSWLFKWTIR